ncbi:MAG: LysM peptidoglycan-binding domain-containing protein [Brevundimonas sp.]|nr:MAG: LysM peptidoglycan-binding domain-containing protein [Brevundimonas sp.]
MMMLAACGTYPSEPRYPTHPISLPAPEPVQPEPYEPPAPDRAPIAPIEGGSLPPPAARPSTTSQPTYQAPASTPAPVRPPVSTVLTMPGAPVAYVIQPGDTISGVGRRFQTPVQTLIDLNNLGPRAAISSGQALRLPDTAVDVGSDPYATGPSPVGVMVLESGATPPPSPPPPSGNPPAPRSLPTQPVITPPASSAATPSPVSTGATQFQWPVRGEVVRRFGPAGMGERNNGINIAAAEGAEVRAAAAGRVAYVGDQLVGQGLTVLIVHRDGWRTVYGHLGSSSVDDGADVRAGQVIGTVGATAGDGRPSMHFEARRMQGDEPVAVDPQSVLPR